MSEKKPNKNDENNAPGRSGGGRNDNNKNNNLRFSRGLFGWVVFLALAVMLVVFLNQSWDKPKIESVVEFENLARNSMIKDVVIEDNELIATLFKGDGTAPGTNKIKVKFPPTMMDSGFIEYLDRTLNFDANGERVREIEWQYKSSNNFLIQLLPNVLIWLLIFAFIWFFVFRQLRNVGGGAGMLGNFGRSRHRVTTKEHTNITFGDVAGIDEAKDEVAEIIEFLRNPKKFQRLGGRIPRGLLLVGPPGTGKTLLAKAIAGEADVPFFSISGSDFVEMFVGVGASRVRDLFKQAKDNSPCIIFLDEIDAVGRRRGANFSGGGHDEREQTLNAILVEMDGFDTNDQVIVCAATNRGDVLDSALTRPGRFDRQIDVPLPDVKGRLEILKVHGRKVKLGEDCQLERLARGTPTFSGADLAAIINEAALKATMEGKDAIEMVDLEESRDKVRWGRARKSRVVDEKEKVLTAYHEAGHALLTVLLPDADPLHKVSIIPRGSMAGATFMLPEKDRYTMGRKQAVAQLQIAFGGRISEQMFCDDITSGAAMDIRMATELVKHMVLDWGMSEVLGPIQYSAEEGGIFELTGARDISDKTAAAIDGEIKRIIDETYKAAQEILETNRQKLDRLGKALLKYETLDSKEVDLILAGKELDRSTVDDTARDADSVEVQPAPSTPETDADPGFGQTSPQPG